MDEDRVHIEVLDETVEPHHRMLQAIDEDIEANDIGWDNYSVPVLFIAYRYPWGFTAATLPVPPTDTVSRMLEFMTRIVSTDPGPLRQYITEELYGWGLVTEGWTVPRPDKGTREEQALWEQAAHNGEFHLHPGRKEERTIFLATRYERMVFLHKPRGGEAHIHDIYPDTTRVRMHGSVPDQLKELMQATQQYLPQP